MKTQARFILADNRGQVYECFNREHKCRIEIKVNPESCSGVVTWYWEDNPIPLTDAIEALNDYFRARHAEYVTWAQKHNLEADLPLYSVSA